MATSRISPDADAVVSEIEMAAPPERVYEALIDRKQVMQWWTSEQCARWSVGWAAGGAMTQRKAPST